MMTLETSLLAQLHVPLWWRSASHGISERLLDHTPQFMTALLPKAVATFLHGKEVNVWMMSCGALVSNPGSYIELAAKVDRQVNHL